VQEWRSIWVPVSPLGFRHPGAAPQDGSGKQPALAAARAHYTFNVVGRIFFS